MMKKTIILLFVALLLGVNNLSANTKTEFSETSLLPGEKERIVLITTEYGDIKVKLYNETPLHRDNFVKLVEEGFYDSTIFHRVISQFMIQGGDPDSKKALPGQQLGNGGPGYTIPAEFNSKLIHKKGVLAAARNGDNVNPEKKSSGSQFYIVQGKVYTAEEMDMQLKRMNQQVISGFFSKFIHDPKNTSYKNKVDSLRKAQNMEGLVALQKEIEEMNKTEMDKLPLKKFTEEQIKAYTTVGGTPHLDGNYTVFGEVISGLEVIDLIADVEKDKSDRPLKDIKMSMKLLK